MSGVVSSSYFVAVYFGIWGGFLASLDKGRGGGTIWGLRAEVM
jgi:hypothetical protein